jgi:hypothetical protein
MSNRNLFSHGGSFYVSSNQAKYGKVSHSTVQLEVHCTDFNVQENSTGGEVQLQNLFFFFFFPHQSLHAVVSNLEELTWAVPI